MSSHPQRLDLPVVTGERDLNGSKTVPMRWSDFRRLREQVRRSPAVNARRLASEWGLSIEAARLALTWARADHRP